MRIIQNKFPFLALLAFTACTTVRDVDDCFVAAVVEERISKDVYWKRVCYCEDQIADLVQFLLREEFSVDAAVQIALLNNPEIQAEFEEIGIAHADLVAAGLFQNPFFEAFFRIPDHSALSLNTEFSVTQAFLDLLLIPMKKRVAAAELEKVQVKVSHAILNLAFDVQETFYRLAAEQEKVNLMESLVAAAEAACQLAYAQIQQGNINDLELQNRENAFLQHKIEWVQSQVEIVRLEERLNRLLGLSGCGFELQPNPSPCQEISLECLENLALSKRLDLEAARWNVIQIARKYPTMQWWAYTDLAGGIACEKDPDGTWTRGPALLGAIPLFNFGQADRARLQAMYRQNVERLKALEIKVITEVRSAYEQMKVQQELAFIYQTEFLPLQEQIVSMSQRFYNTMSLSVYKLLDAKQQELQTRINYASALKNYWIARVELDRALGGNLHFVIGMKESTP